MSEAAKRARALLSESTAVYFNRESQKYAATAAIAWSLLAIAETLEAAHASDGGPPEQ